MAQRLDFITTHNSNWETPFISNAKNIHYQLPAELLIRQTLDYQQGVLNNTGALVVHTGEFTGRSPKDKFIVLDQSTAHTVNWGQFNNPIDEKYYDIIYRKMCDYLIDKPLWIRNCLACAHPDHALPIRVVNETPWANLFCYNMFIRPGKNYQIKDSTSLWTIIHAPGFNADPETDGTRQHNFSIINFSKRFILIGGSAYTGEIKKGIFTVLNYLLPRQHSILSMHCSANIGADNDTALFFGLSGTGKTTLSTDPDRKLIGDDEHGWNDTGVFNFEGGCYAKCIGLKRYQEPEIYKAIRTGALLENVMFIDNTNQVDFASAGITENTRVSYPINFIDNIAVPSIGGIPENIFFLTCDATGVLPPITRLNSSQAMYYFISGYTAKIAGTEAGIKEPQSTFSACFGAPFLPLHPFEYARLLGEKIKIHRTKVWMINTGWTGGPYGIGKRISLSYTRAMIKAALKGKLNDVMTELHPVFDLLVPLSCPDVPAEILNPKNTWKDKTSYDQKAKHLALEFNVNFIKYMDNIDEKVVKAGPRI